MTTGIRWGIIGAAVVEELTSVERGPDSGFRIVGLCDADAPAARAAAARIGTPFVTTDPLDLVSQPEIDAVFVGGSAADRFTHSMAALSAGKRVLSALPVAADYSHAVDLARESDRRNAALWVANPSRLVPAVGRIQAMASAGDFGAIEWVDCRVDVSGDTALDPLDLSVPLDLLAWVGGDIVDVLATASHGVLAATVRFADGAVGMARALRLPAVLCSRAPRLEVGGSEGAMVGGQFVLARRPHLPPLRFAVETEAYDPVAHVREFQSVLSGGVAGTINAWAAVKISAALEAAAVSLQESGWVRVAAREGTPSTAASGLGAGT